MSWERRRILIWGKTRPALSRSYKETVCTGGVFADTRGFVRLYPIPLRFLDDDQVFRKYQWIDADVRKSASDPRPESYNIRPDSIVVGDTIPTVKGDWGRRAEWVTEPAGHVFPTVAALQAARTQNGTSIGLVKPAEVLAVHTEPYSRTEREEFWTRYQGILQQQELPFEPETTRPVRPLPAPEYRFKIRFRSGEGQETREHDFTVYDWEVDALFHGLLGRGDGSATAREKVVSKLRDEVCGPTKDTHFFLGNMSAHPHVFSIVGLWYPKRTARRQPTLLDVLQSG